MQAVNKRFSVGQKLCPKRAMTIRQEMETNDKYPTNLLVGLSGMRPMRMPAQPG